jgi:hypothetical protein
VFDKVYFPGGLGREIERIVEATRGRPSHKPNLIGILGFIKHAKTLQGFVSLTATGKFALTMFRTVWLTIFIRRVTAPIQKAGIPTFITRKAMPGSDESIRYPGDNYCLAGALLHSAKTGSPLLNDTPGLAVPLIFVGQDNDKAKHHAAMLAIECVKLALPELC